MNVLIIGSGGREHALGWKAAQSSRLSKLYFAPGNAGTAQLGENLPLAPSHHAGLRDFALEKQVELVVVGPEAPLADGLADDLRLAGLRVFGPSQKAAQIEASKTFAKQFMQRHAIPTAPFAIFSRYEDALAYLEQTDGQIVIKASGLAAGKGVIVPENREESRLALRRMLLECEFGEAGREVIIEQRLAGEEVSLLAFTDGVHLAVMPPAQDHKRLLDGDRGPNTGGMGAYAPAQVCPPALAAQITRLVLQPAADGLRQEGRPFVGVLYAGLMLTPQGPSVLEFNCRFGDPETQAILPLLETDLLDLMEACVEGRLDELEVKWSPGAAACVVLASQDYPGKSPLGRPISGLEGDDKDSMVFHAGTRLVEGRVLTAGGRVLGATGWGASLQTALQRAYAALDRIHFDGMQFRRDIGWRALTPQAAGRSAYARAGVDIEAGNRAVALMEAYVRATYDGRVLAGIGAFGGLFDASELQGMHSPVLVASIDGVGTKVKLAAQAGRYASLGVDIVNHCINDILVQGARPLFFLDYFASSRLQPAVVAEAVSGMASACQEAGCALIGGETAEMPGVYAGEEFDVAGAIVGVLEREARLPRLDLQAGDVLIGLASSGPHTNGYSLIREVFSGVPLDETYPELEGCSLGEALLAPHRSYLPLLRPILENGGGWIKALAHLTGGGFIENIPRILPEGLAAHLQLGSWQVPPLFRLIQRMGSISEEEMVRVFNMGIGMVAVVASEHAPAVQEAVGETTWIIGELVRGEKGVRLG